MGIFYTCLIILQKRKGKKTPMKEGDGGQARQQPQPQQGAGGGAGLLSNSKGSLASNSRTRASSSSSSQPMAAAHATNKNSDLWWKARHNLLSNFDDDSVQLSIPCFVSTVNSGSTEEQTSPTYRYTSI